MKAKLDIGALRALCAIADRGGVSRAAASLALSQSAVSHKIKRLEESLGCAVLDRRAGHPLLTREGEKLLRFARRILALHDDAVSTLSTEPLSGHIRLGVTEDATSGGLSSVLARFTRLQPAVRVQIGVAQSRIIGDRLASGELDVGVLQVFAEERRADDVTLASDALHWVKSPDLAMETGRPIPLLTFDQDCFYRDWALHAEPPPPSGFQIVIECASIAGILSAVKAGLGVTLLNARHLQPDMEIVTDGFPTPPDIAYVLRAGRSAHTSSVKALVRTLTSDADWHRPLSPR
ncbi:LysR family transcriptional regulator [Aurantimonas sp. 22II-16-19i]|uniref:LysR family transcriptional regulator n=1 Tax=Aurantimonas sp. 22II-16-19i TaxID=1317114 RepID=UPI0009F7A73C|nr:LysR family transcriptional regulator [Aurantimonas sp. 22II-16-19i]ORE90739.1 transcriptional regulator [Aurantimonas sp. 22II-16-19i]